MPRSLTPLGAALALGVLLAGCPQSTGETPLKELVVKKVAVDLSKPDPEAAFWSDVPGGFVSLVAQPMITPRPALPTTERVAVQAAHDGTRVAFRLRWKDTEKSEAGRLGEFSDAFALEFPLKEGPPPPVIMGEKGNPVHIFHWRAQYQRDKERGKPLVKDIYPNVSIDMYPLEFKDAKGASSADAEKFSPGRVEGNPQSYEKTGVDEIIAEGFATSSVQEGHGSLGQGTWKDGEWTLVVVRPLAIENGSSLKPGAAGNVAFAAWQGGKGEVGSRKCVALSWLALSLQ